MAEDERKALPSRANRGNRMERLMAQEEEADEADKEFYEQAFWADAEGDDEFVHESGESEESTSDSDISDEDADDDDDDEDEDEAPTAAGSKRKAGAYVDPSAKRAKAGGKAAAGKAGGKAAAPPDPEVAAAAAQARAEAAAERRKKRAAAAREGGGTSTTIQRGSLRASTIKASVEASEERLRQQAAAAKMPKQPAGARKKKEFRRLTQEELLAEARQTEIINRASLEAMLRMEEAKRVVHAKTRAPAGPRVRTHSKGGLTTLTFIETGIPDTIRAKAPEPPAPARCVVTGLPAKYRDPQTGTAYATLEAFRTIRGRGRSRSQTHGPAHADSARGGVVTAL